MVAWPARTVNGANAMKRVCVFCGSSAGGRAEYLNAAAEVGRALVRREIGLVYGGGGVGLMGQLARAVLAAGGDVTGVIPAALQKRELALEELSDLRIVESMHDRKALMADLADGFLALPGGLGTIEEFFEILTWTQLGIHEKPSGLLNVAGYFEGLIGFLDYAVEEEFIRPEHRSLVLTHEDPEVLLDLLDSFEPAGVDKAEWILSRDGR
jgi:uncharacterized protein (TIGR00730 family)